MDLSTLHYTLRTSQHNLDFLCRTRRPEGWGYLRQVPYEVAREGGLEWTVGLTVLTLFFSFLEAGVRMVGGGGRTQGDLYRLLQSHFFSRKVLLETSSL